MLKNPSDHDRDPVPGLAPLIRANDDIVADSYLVRLKADAGRLLERHDVIHPDRDTGNQRVWAAAQRAREAGISITDEFDVLGLFAATMSSEQLRIVRQDPDVAYIEQDTHYYPS